MSAAGRKQMAKPDIGKGTQPVQVVDLTGGDTPFRYAEIRTDAGIIRVNAGLVTTRAPSLSRIVIEVEVNTCCKQTGSGDGDWLVSYVGHNLGSTRHDIKVTRKDG